MAAASRLSRAEDAATTVPHIRLWYTDDGHDELEREVALHCLYTMSVIEADSFEWPQPRSPQQVIVYGSSSQDGDLHEPLDEYRSSSQDGDPGLD